MIMIFNYPISRALSPELSSIISPSRVLSPEPFSTISLPGSSRQAHLQLSHLQGPLARAIFNYLFWQGPLVYRWLAFPLPLLYAISFVAFIRNFNSSVLAQVLHEALSSLQYFYSVPYPILWLEIQTLHIQWPRTCQAVIPAQWACGMLLLLLPLASYLHELVSLFPIASVSSLPCHK